MSENVLEMPEFVASDGTRAAVAGRLFNFQTGKSTLQEGHRKWLKKKVVPAIMERPNVWIDLYGYASKIGNRQYNLTLSESRAKAVKKYLAERLAEYERNGTHGTTPNSIWIIKKCDLFEKLLQITTLKGDWILDYFGSKGENGGLAQVAANINRSVITSKLEDKE